MTAENPPSTVSHAKKVEGVAKITQAESSSAGVLCRDACGVEGRLGDSTLLAGRFVGCRRVRLAVQYAPAP
jgi:hypothetical protein